MRNFFKNFIPKKTFFFKLWNTFWKRRSHWKSAPNICSQKITNKKFLYKNKINFVQTNKYLQQINNTWEGVVLPWLYTNGEKSSNASVPSFWNACQPQKLLLVIHYWWYLNLVFRAIGQMLKITQMTFEKSVCLRCIYFAMFYIKFSLARTDHLEQGLLLYQKCKSQKVSWSVIYLKVKTIKCMSYIIMD